MHFEFMPSAMIKNEILGSFAKTSRREIKVMVEPLIAFKPQKEWKVVGNCGLTNMLETIPAVKWHSGKFQRHLQLKLRSQHQLKLSGKCHQNIRKMRF